MKVIQEQAWLDESDLVGIVQDTEVLSLLTNDLFIKPKSVWEKCIKFPWTLRYKFFTQSKYISSKKICIWLDSAK